MQTGLFRTTQIKVTRRVHIYNPFLFSKYIYFAQIFQFFFKKRRKVDMIVEFQDYLHSWPETPYGLRENHSNRSLVLDFWT